MQQINIPKQTFQFLKKLEKNNNRQWFAENKSTFEIQVMQPALKFVEEFGEALSTKYPDIRYDTSRNGSGSMFRIYRDVRFSKDKSPYKTNLGFVFWTGDGNKKQSPAIYLHLGIEGVNIYAGQYWMSKSQIDNFRQSILLPTSGEQFIQVMKKIKKAGIEMVGGLHYKRVPRGFDPQHPRAEWLKYTGLYVGMPELNIEEVIAEDFKYKALKQAAALKPLIEWLKANV